MFQGFGRERQVKRISITCSIYPVTLPDILFLQYSQHALSNCSLISVTTRDHQSYPYSDKFLLFYRLIVSTTMHNFLSKRLQRVRSAFKPQSPYPPAWPLYGDQHAKPEMNAQNECPLFGKLSTELRILIYEATLIDRGRLLHICTNSFSRRRKAKDAVRRNAHFWCIDQESPFPTWQHACYGEIQHPTGKFTCRRITRTDDQLLSLLLTCRLMCAYNPGLAAYD